MLLALATGYSQKNIKFESPELYPEGVAYDAKEKLFYVSSARLGTVGKVDMAGKYSILYTDTAHKSSYGMKVHPDGRRLFVCISDANYSKFSDPSTYRSMARLISIDLRTGKKLSDTDLSRLVPGKHFANDVAFDKEGNAYVTDSFANAIYKVSSGQKATVFAKSDLFKTEGAGLNGIVVHPNGYLLVASSGKGCVFKIDLKDPTVIQMVKVDQFFPGADGLAFDGKSLSLVQNGGVNKIFKLESKDDFVTAEPIAATAASQLFGFPSTATLDGTSVWVIDAKFNQLKEKNSVPLKEFKIEEAAFKSL